MNLVRMYFNRRKYHLLRTLYIPRQGSAINMRESLEASTLIERMNPENKTWTIVNIPNLNSLHIRNMDNWLDPMVDPHNIAYSISEIYDYGWISSTLRIYVSFMVFTYHYDGHDEHYKVFV